MTCDKRERNNSPVSGNHMLGDAIRQMTETIRQQQELILRQSQQQQQQQEERHDRMEYLQMVLSLQIYELHGNKGTHEG